MKEERKIARYGFIATTLSIPFILLNVLYAMVALISGEGWTAVRYNLWGELLPEVILFVTILVIVFYYNIKLLKAMRRSG